MDVQGQVQGLPLLVLFLTIYMWEDTRQGIFPWGAEQCIQKIK